MEKNAPLKPSQAQTKIYQDPVEPPEKVQTLANPPQLWSKIPKSVSHPMYVPFME